MGMVKNWVEFTYYNMLCYILINTDIDTDTDIDIDTFKTQSD